MRRYRLVLSFVFALVAVSACAPSEAPRDAAPDDASCGDAPCVDAHGAGGGSCQPNGHGGQDCVGGPCSFDCCDADGHLSTCSIFQGSECAFVRPIDCGGGRCVLSGSCPDAGT